MSYVWSEESVRKTIPMCTSQAWRSADELLIIGDELGYLVK